MRITLKNSREIITNNQENMDFMKEEEKGEREGDKEGQYFLKRWKKKMKKEEKRNSR